MIFHLLFISINVVLFFCCYSFDILSSVSPEGVTTTDTTDTGIVSPIFEGDIPHSLAEELAMYTRGGAYDDNLKEFIHDDFNKSPSFTITKEKLEELSKVYRNRTLTFSEEICLITKEALDGRIILDQPCIQVETVEEPASSTIEEASTTGTKEKLEEISKVYRGRTFTFAEDIWLITAEALDGRIMLDQPYIQVETVEEPATTEVPIDINTINLYDPKNIKLIDDYCANGISEKTTEEEKKIISALTGTPIDRLAANYHWDRILLDTFTDSDTSSDTSSDTDSGAGRADTDTSVNYRGRSASEIINSADFERFRSFHGGGN